jgi:hypothetical protein
MDRPIYLDELIRKQHNGMVKIVTGVRRCGKSYLLFNLFYHYLKQQSIDDDHIISMAMDDIEYKAYRNPEKLYYYIKEKILDNGMYYVLLDEVQLVENFEEVLNSLLKKKNVDVYVTGSNARFLSKDIITEFRGRGDQVHVYPLSFSEFWEYYRNKHTSGVAFPISGPFHFETADISSAWQEYITYGGMPGQVTIENVQDKSNYLKNLFNETYFKDIVDRNKVRNEAEMEDLMNLVASDIGSLTNPLKIANTFKSEKKVSVHQETIKNFLNYYEDAFLISKAKRYDIKGKKYINTPVKYYFTDVGLRNALLNFRQIEETHLMENIIYNELLIRGYNVDVGVVDHYYTDDNDQRRQKKLEVDFVCNRGSNRIYIQSALSIPDKNKMEQEQASIIKIKDSFRKIIIVKDGISHYNEEGVFIMNLFDFLLKNNEI